jgi:hypothetical protein
MAIATFITFKAMPFLPVLADYTGAYRLIYVSIVSVQLDCSFAFKYLATLRAIETSVVVFAIFHVPL